MDKITANKMIYGTLGKGAEFSYFTIEEFDASKLYGEEVILPTVIDGKQMLMVAHGSWANTIRVKAESSEGKMYRKKCIDKFILSTLPLMFTFLFLEILVSLFDHKHLEVAPYCLVLSLAVFVCDFFV